jgi:hypothetical protein
MQSGSLQALKIAPNRAIAAEFQADGRAWASLHPEIDLSGGETMEKAGEWTRNLLAMIGVFALGYWLASGRPVHASSDDVQFELQGINDSSSLLVYQPSTKTVYVYRGAMTGNSALQCNFMFKMTQPGGVVNRENCAVQTLR